MESAPPPVLNDTAPQINLLERFTNTSEPRAFGQPGVSLPPIDLSGVIPVVFSIIFLIWTIYSIVIMYHWFRYHHRSWFAVPAIVMHFVVSGFIILFMISGLR
ncbi:MAG: hypothetical protein AB202_01315 [Parcubacteria bacterium C7867-007]|nr:MAG: hypothetical protein AB202_01315 [Parcubacteria bacterium C7867-007]